MLDSRKLEKYCNSFIGEPVYCDKRKTYGGTITGCGWSMDTMIIGKVDREILKLYGELPFPSILYEEEYDYITSLDSLLHGYCQRLLDGLSVKYAPCEEEESSVEREFEEAIKSYEGPYELKRYYHMYKLAREILKEYATIER